MTIVTLAFDANGNLLNFTDSERQMGFKQVHVIISAVCRKRNLYS